MTLTSTFDLKIHGFPGLIVEHLYATLGDPSCIGFRDIMWINRHTNILCEKQTNAGGNPTSTTAVSMVINISIVNTDHY